MLKSAFLIALLHCVIFNSPQNILEKGREVYEEFFKYYPYCYGYWKKYADLEKKNGNMDLAKKACI